MERNKIIKAILFLMISTSIGSCNLGTLKKKGFYDYSRISYIYRLPLIEPYEIQSPDNGNIWTLGFRTSPPPSIMGVQFLSKVGIKQSIIVVYSKNDFSHSSEHPELWTVINTSAQTENIFLTADKYERYLKSQNIHDIKLYDINEVFKIFDTEKRLPIEWGNQPKQK